MAPQLSVTDVGGRSNDCLPRPEAPPPFSIEKIRARDPEWWGAYWAYHRQALEANARKHVAGSDVKDFVQGWFAEVLASCPAFRGSNELALGSFVNSIRHHLLCRYREKASRQRAATLSGIDPPAGSARRTLYGIPKSQIEVRVRAHTTAVEYALVEDFYFHGLSYKEMAALRGAAGGDATDKKAASLRTQMKRLLARLAPVLAGGG